MKTANEKTPVQLALERRAQDLPFKPESERLRALRQALVERYEKNPPLTPGNVGELIDRAEARLLAMAILLEIPVEILTHCLDEVARVPTATDENLDEIRNYLGIPVPAVSLAIMEGKAPPILSEDPRLREADQEAFANVLLNPLDLSLAPERAHTSYEHLLKDKAHLERLSSSAIRAFFKIGEAWGLSSDEQRTLLGDISEISFRRWKQDQDAKLSEDHLERISHILGIYKSLQILLPTTADGWVRRPNSHPLFGGRPVIDLMMGGGIPALRQVRLFLEAERGG